jgi:RNase P subunit RPR2
MLKLKIFLLQMLIAVLYMLAIISIILFFSPEVQVPSILSSTILIIAIIALRKHKNNLTKKFRTTCKYCHSSLVGSATSHQEIRSYSTTKGDQYSVVLIKISCSNCQKNTSTNKNFLTYRAERVDNKTGNLISGSTSYVLQHLIDEELKVYQ